MIQRLLFVFFLMLFGRPLMAQWKQIATEKEGRFIGNAHTEVLGSRLSAFDTYRGMCYSDDGGNTWQQALLSSQVASGSIKRTTQQFYRVNGNRLNQVTISPDSGATWHRVGSPLPNGIEGFGYTSKRVVALAYGYPNDLQLYWSNDQAQTWRSSESFRIALAATKRPISGPFNLHIAGDTVYVSSWAGLFMSADEGQTWRTLYTGKVSGLGIMPECLLMGTDNGLQISTDKGSSWSVVQTGIGEANQFYHYKDFYFALGGGQNIRISADKGRTWRAFGQGLPSDSQAELNGLYQWGNSFRVGGRVVNGSQTAGFQSGKCIWSRALSETDINYLQAPTALYCAGLPVANNDLPVDQFQLTWIDNSTNETSFVVERSTTDNQSFVRLATLPANIITYLDKTVQPGTRYYYRVRATNANGLSDPTLTVFASKPQACQTVHRLSSTLRDITFLTDAIGYCVGDAGTLLKTTDGGQNWQQLTHSAEGTLRKVQFINQQVGFVGGTQGLLKTIDGGQTWALFRILGMSEGVGQMHFFDENRGIVTEFSDSIGKIYLTTDGGRSWSSPASTGQNGRKLDLVNSLVFPGATVGYLAGERSSISKTTDAGATWRLLTIISPLGTSEIYSHLFFLDIRRGYAFGRKTVFRTEDGGDTWRSFPLPITTTLRAVSFSDWDNGLLAVDYDEQQRRIFYQTTDAGATWKPISTTYAGGYLAPTLVGLYGRQADLWAVGTFQNNARRLMRSTDRGMMWQTLSNDDSYKKAVSMAFRNAKEGVLLRNELETTRTYLYTTDGGEFWQQRTLPGTDAGRLVAAQFFADGTGVVVGQTALWRTANGGLTWQRLATNRPFELGQTQQISREYIHFVSAQVWNARDLYDRCYQSTDGGVNWRIVVQQSSVRNNGFSFSNASFGSALNGIRSDLSYTTDGGETWQKGQLTIGLSSQILWPTMVSPLIAYASAPNEGAVLKTTDGGATWYPISYEWWKNRAPGHVLATYGDAIFLGDQLVRLLPGTRPSPENFFKGKSPLCENDSAEYITYANKGWQYRWSIASDVGTIRVNRERVTVQWTRPGKQEITLRVIDGCGESLPTTFTVLVNPNPPKPIITLLDSVLASSFSGENRWQSSSGNIPFSSTQTLPLFRNNRWREGTYYVTAIDTTGCASLSDPFLFKALHVEPALSTFVHVYPNPASNYIKIELPFQITDSTVDVVDIQGRSIGHYPFTSTSKIPVNTLPSGIYLLRIQANQRIYTCRLVVQR